MSGFASQPFALPPSTAGSGAGSFGFGVSPVALHSHLTPLPLPLPLPLVTRSCFACVLVVLGFGFGFALVFFFFFFLLKRLNSFHRFGLGWVVSQAYWGGSMFVPQPILVFCAVPPLPPPPPNLFLPLSLPLPPPAPPPQTQVPFALPPVPAAPALSVSPRQKPEEPQSAAPTGSGAGDVWLPAVAPARPQPSPNLPARHLATDNRPNEQSEESPQRITQNVLGASRTSKPLLCGRLFVGRTDRVLCVSRLCCVVLCGSVIPLLSDKVLE
jgi:hypothetical protein